MFFLHPCMIANPRKQVPPCPRRFLLEIKALPRWPDPSVKSMWPMQKHMIHGMRRRSKTRSKEVSVFRWEPAKTPKLTPFYWLTDCCIFPPFCFPLYFGDDHVTVSSIAIAGSPVWTNVLHALQPFRRWIGMWKVPWFNGSVALSKTSLRSSWTKRVRSARTPRTLFLYRRLAQV